MLARNKEYLQLAVDYAQAVVISAELLKPFPDWMKQYEKQKPELLSSSRLVPF